MTPISVPLCTGEFRGLYNEHELQNMILNEFLYLKEKCIHF
jgi:hypothetical protein